MKKLLCVMAAALLCATPMFAQEIERAEKKVVRSVKVESKSEKTANGEKTAKSEKVVEESKSDADFDDVESVIEAIKSGDLDELIKQFEAAGLTEVANALKKLGVRKGDFVSVYLPVVPEAIAAMLACARIGAVHSVVFSGFSAEALAGRIEDCRSRVLITAFFAPNSRRCLVILRVSTPSMATMLCLARYSGSVAVARQLLGSKQHSRMTNPRQNGRRDSTSCSFTP